MYKLKQGINTIGSTFFTIEVNDKVFVWEVIDDNIAFWGEWPEEWMPMCPTYDSSRLSFLLHEGRDLEETIRISHKLAIECGLK